MVQRKEEIIPFYHRISEYLNTHITPPDPTIFNFATAHPFTSIFLSEAICPLPNDE